MSWSTWLKNESRGIFFVYWRFEDFIFCDFEFEIFLLWIIGKIQSIDTYCEHKIIAIYIQKSGIELPDDLCVGRDVIFV